jgi:hypothetical protein
VPPPFPWIYPYHEDPAGTKLFDREVLRPMVTVSVAGMRNSVLGLVDSGSERTIIAPWIGRELGLYPDSDAPSIPLGMGGEILPTAIYQASLRLHAPDPHGDDYLEWETEIGVPTKWRAPVWNAILGGIGFFNRYTVTMQRDVQAMVVESFETFEERFSEHMPQ